MDEMNVSDPMEMIEAVRCWTGWGNSAIPRRSDERLLERFGCGKGTDLLSQIKSLEDEFYLSDAHIVAVNIQDMARRCANDFRARRPGVPEEIISMFVWCYTFDYK